MQRVTGIGGIFFMAKDPAALRSWYQKHLGIDVTVWGGAVFPWTDAAGTPVGGSTIWCVAPEGGEQFTGGSAPFVINYRVADLDALVSALRTEGCELLGEPQDSEFGKFAWVLDPEGHRVELWQPPAGS